MVDDSNRYVVVIPVYNLLDYTVKCLERLLNESVRHE